MAVNERLIKVSNSVPINVELKMDQDVEVIIKGSVVKIEEGSNQDGTVDRKFILKSIQADVKTL